MSLVSFDCGDCSEYDCFNWLNGVDSDVLSMFSSMFSSMRRRSKEVYNIFHKIKHILEIRKIPELGTSPISSD